MTAPSVQTVRHDVGWISAHTQDVQSAIMRSKKVAQLQAVVQPAYQFSVPPFAYKIRGNWTARDVPTSPIDPINGVNPYPYPVEAPEISYRNKTFNTLIARAANPIQPIRYSQGQLSAPSVQVSISS